MELARAAGLTAEHLQAIRSTGISDAGKARKVQRGSGKNGKAVKNLAAEAKKALGGYLGVKSKARPGQQHQLDAEYFDRIEAMDFALATDDGQRTRDYKEADVVVIGVSRTSKTPTCIYLANQGIKAANVPFIPGTPLPDALDERKDGLIVGLTKDPKRLVQIRRNRLRMLHQEDETDYTDPELVKREVRDAHRFFVEKGWPVIDVTRRSIEETAAAILGLLEHRSTAPGNAPDQT